MASGRFFGNWGLTIFNEDATDRCFFLYLLIGRDVENLYNGVRLDWEDGGAKGGDISDKGEGPKGDEILNLTITS